MPKHTLYHGSPYIVENPSLDKGKPYNDYGRGFYCTPSRDLACEWACKRKSNGYANRYTLDDKRLAVLDLLDGSYTALHWIALLLANREFSLSGEIAPAVRQLLIERYLPDTSSADIVIGYRADDAYFSFAESFVEGSLSLQGLEQALFLGNLGEQVALVSQKAFEQLAFENAEPVDARLFYPRFIARDQKARTAYRTKIAGQQRPGHGLFALDILRMEEADFDARVQRIAR